MRFVVSKVGTICLLVAYKNVNYIDCLYRWARGILMGIVASVTRA